MATADHALFDQWRRKGDPESFRTLTERYAGMVYATGLRILRQPHDAEDVSQAAFEKLARLRHAPKGSIGAWLHRVVTNQSLDLLRARRRRVGRERAYTDARPKQSEIAWDDIYEYVDEAIAVLPSGVREAVVAHFLFNRTHEDIAREAGISRAAVTQRIHRGLEGVRRTLRRRGVPVGSALLLGLLKENLAEASPAPPGLTATVGKIALSSYAAGGVIVSMMPWPVWVAVAVVAIVVVGGAAFTLHGPAPKPTGERLAASTERSHVAEPAQTPGEASQKPETSGIGDKSEQPAAGATISGRVVDADTLEGIDGATVVARPRSQPRTKVEATSAGDGKYSLVGLSPDIYQISVTVAPEHIPLSLLPRQKRIQHIQEVALEAGRPVADVDFALRRGVPISGKSIDDSGKPVPGAVVYCKANDRDMHPMSAVSDDSGTFVVSNVPPDAQFLLWGEAGDLVSDLLGPIAVDASGVSDVVLTLKPEARISGRVVDLQGRPCPGFRIVTQSSPPIREREKDVPTRDDGAFDIAGLSAGGYILKLTREGGTALLNEFQSVPVKTGEHVENVQIVYAGGGQTIFGTVLNALNKPVAKAEVEIRGGRVKTDENGRFTLESLAPGQHALTVSHALHTPVTVEAAAGDHNVVVRLPWAGIFEARVVDAQTGAPIESVIAQWLPPNVYSIPDAYEPKPYPKGKVQVIGPAGQDGAIAIRSPGYRPYREPVVLEEGNNPEVIVCLQPQADLYGTVHTAGGEPVTNAFLFMGRVPNAVVQMDVHAVARSDGQGAFTIPASAVTDNTIGVFHPDYAPRKEGLDEAQLTGEAPIDVTLAKGGTVEGTVTLGGLEDSRLVTNIHTSVGTEYGSVLDGSYRYENLSPGSTSVQFLLMLGNEPIYYRNYSEHVEIVTGGAVNVSHDFVPGTATIQGKISGAAERGVSIRCSVQTDTGLESIMHIGEFATGEYMIDSVPPGMLTLIATNHTSEGATTRHAQITVEDGAAIVHDLAFGNGVSVSGRVEGPADRVLLVVGHDGLEIDLGESSVQRGIVNGTRVVDGTYCFNDVQPGAYMVLPSHKVDEPNSPREYGRPIPIDVTGENDVVVETPLPAP